MHEVFVTGVGAVTCLGGDSPTTWTAISQGRRGVRRIPNSPIARCRTGFAGHVNDLPTPLGYEHHDRSTQFAIVAATEAVRRAGLEKDRIARLGNRAAVVIGSSKGGVLRFSQIHKALRSGGGGDAGRGLAAFWDTVPPDAAAGAVGDVFAIQGPRRCPVAACATSTVAVIQAAQMIRDGEADLVVCGAADACLHPLWIAAFDKMGVLATEHPTEGPAGACRPFDIARNGFAVGEGAGILVLESQSHAQARSARTLARIAGGALGSDASDLIGGDADGRVLASVAALAMTRAQVSPKVLDMVSPHGTGTLLNDRAEALAWGRLASADNPDCHFVAIKGAIGHCLGAAGAIELAMCVESIERQRILPSPNHAVRAPDTANVAVTVTAAPHRVESVLKLSLGFGGHLAAVVLTAG